MMDNNKNKGNGGEFDDDAFDDVEEFSEADFDETSFDENEYADVSADDVEYADEDFADEDWQEEKTGKKNKKDKNLYSTGEKKGMSFNTMVIIGAVVVGGGVMMMTVMNSSKQQAVGGQGIFQSALNIAGVMDGTLFGTKDDSSATDQTGVDQQAQEQGFLDNPDVLTSPPQPAPISPAETDSADATGPLTPMPDLSANEIPRTPDEQVPVEIPASAEETAAPVAEQNLPKAEDILKQAMANRDKKSEVEEQAATPEPVPVSPVPIEMPPVEMASPEQPPVLLQPEPQAVVPAPLPETAAVDTKVVTELENRIETLLSRIDGLEDELSSVHEEKKSNDLQMKETVQSLKKEIAALKERPAPVAAKAEPEVKKAEKPKAVPAPIKAKVAEPVEDTTMSDTSPAPAKKAAVVAQPSGQWELRAAQPGRAWVSKAGERDMQGVEVGQTLAGIGRVTAISYQNGRWTVVGTQGQIQQ